MNEDITIYLTNKWRARFLIYTEAQLSDKAYFVRSCPLRIVEDFKLPNSFYHIDVIIDRDKYMEYKEYKEILYYSMDVMEEFLSQISFILYSKAEEVEIISISPHKVREKSNLK